VVATVNEMSCSACQRSVSGYIIENISEPCATQRAAGSRWAVLSTIRKSVKPMVFMLRAARHFLLWLGDQYNRQMHLCSLLIS
jgi:hypothetical protein